MQKEIIKNLNKDYLRMECDALPETNRYEYRMMNVDSICGLLPCHIRFLNGRAYLYYDISATKSFSSVYTQRKITGKDMEKLAQAIRSTMESLEKHLLEGENLVFDPELIFMDTQTEDIYFLYYPYYSESVGLNFLKLAEFVSTHIDHEDDTLVEKTYQLYERTVSCNDKLPLNEIFQFMENDMQGIMQLLAKQKEKEAQKADCVTEDTEEKIPETIFPVRDEPPALSLFEYRKGKIREKRIAYAVEEPSLKEKYEEK